MARRGIGFVLAGFAALACAAGTAFAATFNTSTIRYASETATPTTQWTRFGLGTYTTGVAATAAFTIDFTLTNGVFYNFPTGSLSSGHAVTIMMGGAGSNMIRYQVNASPGNPVPAGATFTTGTVVLTTPALLQPVSVTAANRLISSGIPLETVTGNFSTTPLATFTPGLIVTLASDTDPIDVNPANPADSRRVFGPAAQLDAGESANRIAWRASVVFNPALLREPDGSPFNTYAGDGQYRFSLNPGFDSSGITAICIDDGPPYGACDTAEIQRYQASPTSQATPAYTDPVPPSPPLGLLLEKTPGVLFAPRTFQVIFQVELFPAAKRPGNTSNAITTYGPYTWSIVEANGQPPGAPTIGTATAGNAQATVAFTAPASDGGYPITSYTVTSSPGNVTATGASSPITVSGLSNGTPYTFTVRATNQVGTGSPSAASNSVTPIGTVPGAPTIGTATAGPARATVSFTPPASNGGYAITNYTATSTPGNLTATGTSSPITVTGLTPFTSYTFRVTATNQVGTGPASAASNSVLPTTPSGPILPGPPTNVSATPGNASVIVTFTPPTSITTTPVTSYRVYCNPGGFTVAGPSPPLTVTGLTNGTTYTCAVGAISADGQGTLSAAVTVTAGLTVPGVPSITAITPGDGRVTLAFAAPASNGGSPITSYRLTCNPGNLNASGSASPLTVTGLTNGTTYSCGVAAVNAVGVGPATPTVNVTPSAAGSVPGAPSITRVRDGDRQVTLEFIAPLSNGGSPITSYVARCTPGLASTTGAVSPLTVTGLQNGLQYSCVVAATNARGTGADSLPVAATPTPPVFTMTVQSNVTATTATVSADIQYRPQDVGTTGNVYVFAVAPESLVRRVDGSEPMRLGLAKDVHKIDVPIGCVLAQLNAAGQLVGVTSANLAAYLTGVLSAQGASVQILNGVPVGNVTGATFFVGYGTSATTMINSGVNRAVVTIPGSTECRPEAPQTGWWWNPLEDGRGFSLEKRGNNLFFASFLYDVSGRSTWYVSTGPVSLEGTLYNGDLLAASGGQTLGGPYARFPTLTSVGQLNLTFNNSVTGTMVWPGGTVPIQRFNVVPNGLNLAPVAGQPESGWWWNEQEAGRGFFMEFQGGSLDIAGYMYDDNGDSVWYLTVADLGGNANARTLSGSWWSYTGGQTLTGAWRQNTRSNSNVAPLTITFSGPDTALMTLPNGRTTNLRRHRF